MKLTVRKRQVGEIPLLEVVPQEQIHDRLPLVIYYHGWQTRKELVLTQGRKLAAKGIRVILPDADNHGERLRPVSPIVSQTFWSSIYSNLFEFEYLLEYFQKLNLVTDKIGVGGVSMGGMTTCGLLTQHPEITAAACIMGTPSPTAYREYMLKRATKEQVKLPKDFQKLLSWVESYDLSLHPETLHNRPLYFWHGRQDEMIPFEDVADFVAKHPKLRLTFVNEDANHLVQVSTMEAVAEFFAQQLRN
ncbi:prolyl oligopeptidase family serine peptidase [Enterococcus asini]|uniref:alpha/beta fold hydrolase n=1 Tax=Enterococcus asini TaxID=57732 RepID=UPI00288D62F1|nr:alpha/beta fold hydrolase [Enterococcus asini]MDT2755868.1 prolyl oligopeptidase family serine peptidase [Enterococcus asini]